MKTFQFTFQTTISVNAEEHKDALNKALQLLNTNNLKLIDSQIIQNNNNMSDEDFIKKYSRKKS